MIEGGVIDPEIFEERLAQLKKASLPEKVSELVPLSGVRCLVGQINPEVCRSFPRNSP